MSVTIDKVGVTIMTTETTSLPAGAGRSQNGSSPRIAERRSVDRLAIDVRERFSRYGIDSMAASGLLADLAGRLGRPLPPTLVWEYPTIEALALPERRGGRAAEGGRCRTGGRSTSPLPSSAWPAASPAERTPPRRSGGSCEDGVDAISEVPPDRWNVEAFYDRGPVDAPGSMSTRWGGFLDEVDRLRRAVLRHLAARSRPDGPAAAPASWSCPGRRSKTRPSGQRSSAGTAGTGVFVGAMWSDYSRLASRGARRGSRSTRPPGRMLSIVAGPRLVRARAARAEPRW